MIAAGAPVVQDVVVTGHDRREVGLLVFLDPAGCRSLCARRAGDAPLAELIRRPEVRERLTACLAAHNAAHPASSRRIARALLLADPPSIQAGEITDKGYVNQRAVLERRAGLVEQLYEGDAAPEVIVLGKSRRPERRSLKFVSCPPRGRLFPPLGRTVPLAWAAVPLAWAAVPLAWAGCAPRLGDCSPRLGDYSPRLGRDHSPPLGSPRPRWGRPGPRLG